MGRLRLKLQSCWAQASEAFRVYCEGLRLEGSAGGVTCQKGSVAIDLLKSSR